MSIRIAASRALFATATLALVGCAGPDRAGERAPLPTPVFDMDTTRFAYLPVGTPLEIEVRLTLADGSLATDYEWLWHAPEGVATSSPERGVERLSFTAVRPMEVNVSGALRVCEDGDYVLCASAERDEAVPEVRVVFYGGIPNGTGPRVHQERVDLAVGERRPIAAVAEAPGIPGGLSVLSHVPMTCTSADPSVVRVAAPPCLLEGVATGASQVTVTGSGAAQTPIAVTVTDVALAVPDGVTPVPAWPADTRSSPALHPDRRFETLFTTRAGYPFFVAEEGYHIHSTLPRVLLYAYTGTGWGSEWVLPAHIIPIPGFEALQLVRAAVDEEGNLHVVVATQDATVVAMRDVDDIGGAFTLTELPAPAALRDSAYPLHQYGNVAESSGLSVHARPGGGIYIARKWGLETPLSALVDDVRCLQITQVLTLVDGAAAVLEERAPATWSATGDCGNPSAIMGTILVQPPIRGGDPDAPRVTDSRLAFFDDSPPEAWFAITVDGASPPGLETFPIPGGGQYRFHYAGRLYYVASPGLATVLDPFGRRTTDRSPPLPSFFDTAEDVEVTGITHHDATSHVLVPIQRSAEGEAAQLVSLRHVPPPPFDATEVDGRRLSNAGGVPPPDNGLVIQSDGRRFALTPRPPFLWDHPDAPEPVGVYRSTGPDADWTRTTAYDYEDFYPATPLRGDGARLATLERVMEDVGPVDLLVSTDGVSWTRTRIDAGSWAADDVAPLASGPIVIALGGTRAHALAVNDAGGPAAMPVTTWAPPSGRQWNESRLGFVRRADGGVWAIAISFVSANYFLEARGFGPDGVEDGAASVSVPPHVRVKEAVELSPGTLGLIVADVNFPQREASLLVLELASGVQRTLTIGPTIGERAALLRLPGGRVAYIHRAYTAGPPPVQRVSMSVTDAAVTAFAPATPLRPMGGASQMFYDAALAPDGSVLVLLGDSGEVGGVVQDDYAAGPGHAWPLALRVAP